MFIQDLTDTIMLSLVQVWDQIALFIPSIIGALIVFIVGLIISSWLGRIVEKILMMSKIDDVFKKTSIPREFERTGFNFSLSVFFGRLTYWFFLIVTLLAVANILLGESNVFNILQPILAFIPDVIKAILILVGTVLLANFLKHTVRASVSGARLNASKALSGIAWWAVIITGVSAALTQLGIATAIIHTIVTGIIAMFAIAGGIAFGLGGKEYANHLLAKFRDQFDGHR